MAVHFVARLVCDNQALVSYYAASYGVKPKVIPYGAFPLGEIPPRDVFCLLYPSDAAADLPCVDLGGRRTIKKKNTPLSARLPVIA